jgi:hypothetical protein
MSVASCVPGLVLCVLEEPLVPPVPAALPPSCDLSAAKRLWTKDWSAWAIWLPELELVEPVFAELPVALD